MKAKALQLGKAISAALFVLLLVVVGTKNALAQTLVATLQHGDDISFYYGTDALVNAHDAAEAGDIITLSSGSFATPWDGITKAITLRGAGCVTDTISGIQPTVIASNVHLGIYGEEGISLTVEGIYFTETVYFRNLNYPKFVKCNFGGFGLEDWSYNMNNAQFNNCKFNGISFGRMHNTTLINCVVWKASNLSTEYAATAFNSILGLYGGNAQALNAYNCIIIRNGWTTGLTDYSVAYNCIGIKQPAEGNGDNPVFNVTTFDCVEYDELSEVFETFEGFEGDYGGSLDFEEPFILNEEIATGFLGNDGTEVSIYGGYMPYTSRPSYQIVKHCTVPNKSDAQGHLNVGVEIYSEDE